METLSGTGPNPRAIDSPVDRRTSPRRNIGDLQIVAAPCADGAMPKQDCFQPVRGRDISTGGIAFYWPVEPCGREMAIGVGSVAGTQYRLVKIIRTARQVESGEYLVACQFSQPIVLGDEL